MVRTYKRKTVDRWSEKDLLEAVNGIKDGQISVKEAAMKYGISRSTLYRYYSHFRETGYAETVKKRKGGRSILNKVEETMLEFNLMKIVDDGGSVSATDVKRICYAYCEQMDIPNGFKRDQERAGDDWYYGFKNRKPNISKLISRMTHKELHMAYPKRAKKPYFLRVRKWIHEKGSQRKCVCCDTLKNLSGTYTENRK